MLHIPLLRRGAPYRSRDVVQVAHHATGQPFVEISQANVGLIRRDLLAQDAMRAALARVPVARLIAQCCEAADRFLNGTLPLGETSQSPQDYVESVSATTGMPHAMVRRSMARVSDVLSRLDDVVQGLTRGLDPGVLDRGFGEVDGHAVSFYPRTGALGVVLPSNSPGVHGLWAPAIAIKTPLVIKPGGAEPWTPYRIVQAMIHYGVPRDAFCYFPSSHAGAGEIVRQTGRSMFFGDASTVGAFAGDPRIELHGPGYSKILFGRDTAPAWRESLDLMVASVAENGGRSCVNASGVWTPSHGAEIAAALAERLVAIVPRASDDPLASLAPFTDGRVARHIGEQIEAGLQEAGAADMTSRLRPGPRLVTVDGRTFLLPTVVHCRSSQHPLANREFLFPFVAVVDVTEEEVAEMPNALGPSLAVTAITRDAPLVDRLLASPLVGRLNLGPIQTDQIVWDQPHEGNLFEHVYARRAFQRAL